MCDATKWGCDCFCGSCCRIPVIAQGRCSRPVTPSVPRNSLPRGYRIVVRSSGSPVSEILAVNDHEFLVDERDSKGLADASTAVQKKIYKIDLAGAQDVSRISGAANLAAKAVSKILFLDVVMALGSKGLPVLTFRPNSKASRSARTS